MSEEKPKAKLVTREFADEIIKAGGKTLMLCFQCGTCTGSCPSGRVTAFRIRKVLRRAQLGFRDDVLPSDDLWLCTTCFTCYERCPRGVEIVDVIMAMRNIAVKQNYIADAHKKVAQNFLNTGHSIPLTNEYKALRKKLGLPELPPTVLADEKALHEFQTILKITGFDKLIGGGK